MWIVCFWDARTHTHTHTRTHTHAQTHTHTRTHTHTCTNTHTHTHTRTNTHTRTHTHTHAHRRTRTNTDTHKQTHKHTHTHTHTGLLCCGQLFSGHMLNVLIREERRIPDRPLWHTLLCVVFFFQFSAGLDLFSDRGESNSNTRGGGGAIWQEFQIREFQYDQSFMYFPEVKVHFLSVPQETKTCLKLLKCFSKILQGKTSWIQVQAKVCTSGIFLVLIEISKWILRNLRMYLTS